MSNENCLAGMKCPQCGYDEMLRIQATAWFDVTDAGTDGTSGAVDWDEYSSCECPKCGFIADVSMFTAANQEEVDQEAAHGDESEEETK